MTQYHGQLGARLPPPPTSTSTSTSIPLQAQAQTQTQRQGGIVHRVPSAKQIATASSSKNAGIGTFASPLTRLEVEGRSRAGPTSTTRTHPALYALPDTSANRSFPNPASPSTTTPAPPVPAIDFNLFRSNSIYSVDSLASYGTYNPSEYGESSSSDYSFGGGQASVGQEEDEEESPSTPKASTATSSSLSYFDSGASPRSRQVSGVKDARGALAPKRTVVPSRPDPATTSAQTYIKQLPQQPTSSSFQLQPVLGRAQNRARARSDVTAHVQAQDHRAHTRDVPQPLQPEQMDSAADWASVHGEQGSDWGDDESQFEWLDTDGAPEAVNGNKGGGAAISSGSSPSKRMSRLKAAVVGGGSGGGDGQRKLRKPLILPRRAAPPPPQSAGSTPPNHEPVSPPPNPNSRFISKAISHPAMLVPKARHAPTRPLPHHHHQQPPSNPHQPQMVRRQTDEVGSAPSAHLSYSHSPDLFAPPSAPFARRSPAPQMVPMKTGDSTTSSPKMKRGDTRNSHMSFQSVAYSFYDLDGESSSPSTPKAEGELAFPHGKYVKVSASALERETEVRERTVSEPTRGTSHNMGMGGGSGGYGENGRTPEGFVHAGIEARWKGDMARSAWYFMKAAEGGSPTGRMYWGLSLRHGWGVARDDKHAFAELRRACDESLAEGGVDFHQSPGAVRLTFIQKKNMTKDLSVGLFEVGNCFLEGVGVKRAPDVALAYLRLAGNMGDLASQEQLGFVLSKGSNGVKKDMKEAAKWYRMAISQGSSNTFGLAWVWKDKYMT